MIGLTLNAPPTRGAYAAPRRPTFIPHLPGRPVVFDDVGALAAKVHRVRGGRPIRLRPSVAAYDGSDTFPAFTLYVIGPDGDEQYAGALAVQGLSRERLEAAIAAANPEAPDARAVA
ncbi:MAG: hypothetical protein P4L73_19095 [Caulobacteraceae bacterium]|nr:hypothetical protein [Caulobacteraceae bacterium]